MPEVMDLRDVVEDVILSYEARIYGIESIFDATHFFEDSHEPISNIKEERERINTCLRDTLSMNEHLRKKDFDRMMEDILPAQEGEKEVRNLLKGYLDDQKEMALTLRESLGRFKDSLAKGEDKRIEEFHALTKEILAQQEERKKEVISKLKGFQREQQEMIARFNALLLKGKELRIRDIKEMLAEFKVQHKERIACKEERKREVHNMLADFKKERTEAAMNWQAIQTEKADKQIAASIPVKR